MRHRLKMAAVVGVLAVSVAVATPASAITGGTIDAQNAYANVGLIVNYTEEGRFRCSGTLVTETVVLTAAHCTEGTLGSAIVTFDPIVDLKTSACVVGGQEPPSNLPRATDDAGSGTSSIGYTPVQVPYRMVTTPGRRTRTRVQRFHRLGQLE
jgi:Trypsin